MCPGTFGANSGLCRFLKSSWSALRRWRRKLDNAYAWFVRGAEHAAMCRTSVESVKKADPGGTCIVVTDEPITQWEMQSVVLLRVDPGMPIMLANLEAQVAAMGFSWSSGFERLTLIDTDTLLLKRIECNADL